MEASGKTIRGAERELHAGCFTHIRYCVYSSQHWDLALQIKRPRTVSDVATFTLPGWWSYKDSNIDHKDSFFWGRGLEVVNEPIPKIIKKIKLSKHATISHKVFLFVQDIHSYFQTINRQRVKVLHKILPMLLEVLEVEKPLVAIWVHRSLYSTWREKNLWSKIPLKFNKLTLFSSHVYTCAHICMNYGLLYLKQPNIGKEMEFW